jgi:hypothetical protein
MTVLASQAPLSLPLSGADLAVLLKYTYMQPCSTSQTPFTLYCSLTGQDQLQQWCDEHPNGWRQWCAAVLPTGHAVRPSGGHCQGVWSDRRGVSVLCKWRLCMS